MLDQLNGEWLSFQQCLIDSDVMLKKSKEKFKTGLIHSSEDFKKTVITLFDDFQNKGPFSSSINVKEVCKPVGGGRFPYEKCGDAHESVNLNSTP